MYEACKALIIQSEYVVETNEGWIDVDLRTKDAMYVTFAICFGFMAVCGVIFASAADYLVRPTDEVTVSSQKPALVKKKNCLSLTG